jgi:hypothetical protein
MLYSASKALTIARDKKPLFLEFSKAHSKEDEIAQSSELLISLMGRRKRNSSVYCSCDFFEFICIVECVYLSNLSLKMMMAYADGDIIAHIETSIIGNQAVRDSFVALLGN